MDIRDLTIYLSVYRHQSFSKAAEEHYTTQPAISRKISALEEEYDKVFFHRSSRGVIPTDAGISFAEYAEQFLELYETSQKNIRKKKGSENDQILSIAALAPAAGWFLPTVLSRLLEQNPDVELFMDYYTPREMLDNIKNNYYDLYITITTDLAAIKDMTYIELIRDKPGLVTRKEDAPTSEEEAIRILKTRSIYTISPLTSPSFYKVFRQQLEMLGIQDAVIKEVPRVNTLKYYVLSNMGCVAAPPYLDSIDDDPGLSLYRFKNGPSYNMGLGWKKETPLISAFLKIVRENFQLPLDFSMLSGESIRRPF